MNSTRKQIMPEPTRRIELTMPKSLHDKLKNEAVAAGCKEHEYMMLKLNGDARVEIDYDCAAYDEASPEDRLRILYGCWTKMVDGHTKSFFEGRMLELSLGLSEHPEWFDAGCACDECRTYV